MRALFLVFLLSACTFTKPNVIVTPSLVNCTSQLPIRPEILSDAELKNLSNADFVGRVWNERLSLLIYAEEFEAATAGCKEK